MVSSENIYALVACRSSVYTKWGKRAFDLSLALTGMLLLSPVFMVCSFAVVCSSPGPILFRQRRVGRFGTPIQVLKFRTMFHQPGGNGKRLTVGGDSRITQVGSYLRRFKLDELPQLINVIKGDMSLVGPRPEVPEYVARYTAEQAAVLAMRPGITGAASVIYSNEESELAKYGDSEDFYVRILMPRKLQLDLSYAERISLLTDLKLILSTGSKIVRITSGDRPHPN